MKSLTPFRIDLVFFNTRGPTYSHVGIYVGDGVMLDSAGEVRVWCAEDWSDSYDGWVPAKWGWYGDRKLG